MMLLRCTPCPAQPALSSLDRIAPPTPGRDDSKTECGRRSRSKTRRGRRRRPCSGDKTPSLERRPAKRTPLHSGIPAQAIARSLAIGCPRILDIASPSKKRRASYQIPAPPPPPPLTCCPCSCLAGGPFSAPACAALRAWCWTPCCWASCARWRSIRLAWSADVMTVW